ncbi:MAG: choice-of-anchor J domain-containing protein, partial [Cyclobacteriaceae bacterium]
LDNEDWLVTPAINLRSVDGADLSFDTDWANDNVPLEVFVSADYSGNVTTATWSQLTVILDEVSDYDTWTNSGDVALPIGGVVYVGFKYTSNPTDGSATWTIDNVKVTETLPFFTTSVSSLGDFDRVNVGEVSINKSFILDGFGLTADATVTPPAQFEVSLTDAFTTVGTSTSPLTIEQTDGVIDGVEVFVRFSPTMEGTASGDVTVSTTGIDDITLSVEGFGEADDPVLGLKDVTINIYPNPASSSFSVVNDGNQRIDVTLYGMDGSVMTMKQSGNDYDISHLSSGMYILKLTNDSGEEMTRRIIKE